MTNNQKRYNLTLEGIITLLAPLSHIGETRGTDSLLVRGMVIDEKGQRHEVFRYNGNAFRGMLRDCGALYLFEKLGEPKMNLDTLYLFTAGGAIAGEQTVDLARAERIRQVFQLLSIFGGGAKSQILEGKMSIGFGVPLVRECQSILPERFRNPDAPPWRLWTEEVYFTRMDDAKRETFKRYLVENTLPLPEDERKALPSAQESLFPEQEEEKPKTKKEHAQQMRAMVECLAAGSKLYQRIDLYDMTELELGAFVSCLEYFSRRPYIGGKSGVGFGLCRIEYEYWDNGVLKPFMSIGENRVKACELAEGAKQQYDQFLLELYNKYILENKASMVQMLEGAK
jgi:CRISPR type IV-associated protein Csf2